MSDDKPEGGPGQPDWQTKKEEDLKHLARFCLFLMAVIFGLVAASKAGARLSGLVAIVVFFVVGSLYSFFAAFAIRLCRWLQVVAFPDEKMKWEPKVEIWLAAIWPLALCFWIVITPFYAIINRMYR